MEEQTNTTTTRAGLRYGLIFGLISIINMLVVNMTNMEKPLGFIAWVIGIAMIVMAMLYFRSNNGGLMRYGQGVSTGMAASGVSSVMGSFFFFIYIRFIDTGYIKKLLENTRTELEKNPDLSDDQVNATLEMSSKFMTPELMFIFGLIISLIFGLVISLIVAAILKKENKEF